LSLRHDCRPIPDEQAGEAISIRDLGIDRPFMCVPIMSGTGGENSRRVVGL
jgi:hypothetical protein